MICVLLELVGLFVKSNVIACMSTFFSTFVSCNQLISQPQNPLQRKHLGDWHDF